MKILQVNKLYSPWIGGIETVVKQLAEGANDHADFSSEVLCCNTSFKTTKEIVDGVPVTRASSFGIFLHMPVSLSFFSIFKKMAAKTDVIDLHHPFPLSFVAYWLVRPKARLIVHYHSDIVRQKLFGLLLSPIINSVLHKAEKIIVSNPALITNSPMLHKLSDKCRVVHFGLDIKMLDSKVNEKKVADLRSHHGEYILYVGRLSYYKGLRYLVQAMKELPMNLVIIGNGEERSVLADLVREAGLEPKVFFVPHVESGELLNYYKASKIFVLPSIFKSEAFGLVLLEAMACGIPVISTQIGTGTSYINVDKKTGLVVEPKSSLAIAQAVKTIMRNSAQYEAMGRAGRARVEQEFSLAQMVEHFKQIVSSV